jgi:hypothetical protein
MHGCPGLSPLSHVTGTSHQEVFSGASRGDVRSSSRASSPSHLPRTRRLPVLDAEWSRARDGPHRIDRRRSFPRVVSLPMCRPTWSPTRHGIRSHSWPKHHLGERVIYCRSSGIVRGPGPWHEVRPARRLRVRAGTLEGSIDWGPSCRTAFYGSTRTTSPPGRREDLATSSRRDPSAPRRPGGEDRPVPTHLAHATSSARWIQHRQNGAPPDQRRPGSCRVSRALRRLGAPWRQAT